MRHKCTRGKDCRYEHRPYGKLTEDEKKKWDAIKDEGPLEKRAPSSSSRKEICRHFAKGE